MVKKKVVVLIVGVLVLVVLGVLVWLFVGKASRVGCSEGYLVEGQPTGQVTLTDTGVHMAFIGSYLSDGDRPAGATLWITPPASSEINGADVSLSVGEGEYVEGLGRLALKDVYRPRGERAAFSDRPWVSVCFVPDPGVTPSVGIAQR